MQDKRKRIRSIFSVMGY